MTLIIKTVTLPFTLAASRSAKRMQKFQPEIQALREKFKDNPQKLNQATLELFKEHKINPMGGCLPILITMPLFFGFFSMLQSSAELRFQGFLWAHDLSAPDTVAPALRVSAEHHAAAHGRHDDLPDAPHPAADRGQRAGEDDEIHADHLHVHLLQLLLRARRSTRPSTASSPSASSWSSTA